MPVCPQHYSSLASFTVHPNSALLNVRPLHTLWKRQMLLSTIYFMFSCIAPLKLSGGVLTLALCAACTFGIVVEHTVVCTGVRVGVPEGGGTAAERRELQLLLRQSLLHLSSQSLDEPAESHSHPVYQSCHILKVQFTSFGPDQAK